MKEDFRFFCRNLNFPDLQPMDYTSNMTISNLDAIISQLKEQKSDKYDNNFASKWEEIKDITLANVALNKFIGGV